MAKTANKSPKHSQVFFEALAKKHILNSLYAKKVLQSYAVDFICCLMIRSDAQISGLLLVLQVAKNSLTTE